MLRTAAEKSSSPRYRVTKVLQAYFSLAVGDWKELLAKAREKGASLVSTVRRRRDSVGHVKSFQVAASGRSAHSRGSYAGTLGCTGQGGCRLLVKYKKHQKQSSSLLEGGKLTAVSKRLAPWCRLWASRQRLTEQGCRVAMPGAQENISVPVVGPDRCVRREDTLNRLSPREAGTWPP